MEKLGVNTVNSYADQGYKDNELKTPFSMYVCSVDLENNYVLTRAEDKLTCLVKLYTINSMATDNEYLCTETAHWINDLISISTLISGSSIMERMRFFKLAHEKIAHLRKKIELTRKV